jgi:hypothetical protein
VQPFYRRAGGGGAGCGQAKGGAAGIRPQQGRDVAGASWLGRRESMAAWRARWVCVDSGQERVIWPRAGRGLSRRCALARLAGKHRRLGGRQPLPLDGIEQGRGEKREGGRERERKGSGFKLIFFKILNIKFVGI